MSVAVDEQTFWLGDWKVDPTLNRIVRGEEVVKIDPRNMKVLQLLASKPGHVFSQREIEQAVWADVIVTPNSVYQSIAQLRRALRDEKGSPRYIETISKKGYRLLNALSAGDAGTEAHPTIETSASASVHLRRRKNIKRLVLGSAAISGVILAAGTNLREEPRGDTQAITPLSESAANLVNLGELPEAANVRPRLLVNLGDIALAQGKPQSALDYFNRALSIQRQRAGGKRGALAEMLIPLSRAHLWQSNYAAAESIAREALADLAERPELDPDRIYAMENLGYVFLEAGKYGQAEVHLLEALDRANQVHGENSSSAAQLLLRIGVLRYSQGRALEAEAIARKNLSIHEKIGTDPFTWGLHRTLLVTVLLEQGRYQEALDEAEATLAMFNGGLRDDHPYILATRDLLAKSFLGLDRYSDAERILRDNIVLWQQNDGWSKQAAWSASALGEALLGQNRIAEADGYLSRASLEMDASHPGRQEQQRLREHQERLRRLEAMKTLSEAAASKVADVSNR